MAEVIFPKELSEMERRFVNMGLSEQSAFEHVRRIQNTPVNFGPWPSQKPVSIEPKAVTPHGQE